MNCEICGKTGNLFRTVIEDAELKVCEICSSLGKVLGKVPVMYPSKERTTSTITTQNQPEEVELLVENFNDLIKNSRESQGMTQKEFAKKINEKESIVHKIETGSIKPSIQIARKLEKTLNIKLIEKYQEEYKSTETKEPEDLTIGDLIKIKKR
tara:strand:+ start:186 stop:647 length:462 start_codon:yes stop_codon:yes gene_type:complete